MSTYRQITCSYRSHLAIIQFKKQVNCISLVIVYTTQRVILRVATNRSHEIWYILWRQKNENKTIGIPD